MEDSSTPYLIIAVCVCAVLLVIALVETYLLFRMLKGRKTKLKGFEPFHGNDEVTEEEIISMVKAEKCILLIFRCLFSLKSLVIKILSIIDMMTFSLLIFI